MIIKRRNLRERNEKINDCSQLNYLLITMKCIQERNLNENRDELKVINKLIQQNDREEMIKYNE